MSRFIIFANTTWEIKLLRMRWAGLVQKFGSKTYWEEATWWAKAQMKNKVKKDLEEKKLW
jgi:hypothetical protein